MAVTARSLDPVPPAAAAYDALAPAYDELTSHHRYEEWTRDLERLALAHGLSGRRLLDVGCGTGKSFIPFLARGYAVTACDCSPGMLARARSKPAAARARLLCADMRRMAGLDGEFDLITCIDDCLNHLLDEDDLSAAFGEVRRLLAPAGVYLFDLNSLMTYRTLFAGTSAIESDAGRFALSGEAAPDSPPGSVCALRIEAVVRGVTGVSRHVQRHHPPATVRRLLDDAGLACTAVRGQRGDGGIDDDLDELSHTKAIYIARHPTTPRREGR
jgi:SAM-dependent methyltransferase